MSLRRPSLLCIAIAGLLGLAGCRSEPQGVAVYVSGDTAGWITPCGCAANQSGGLARRGTLIESTQRELASLVLDAGGSASGTTEYQQLKLESILRGMQAMGLAAHNVGDAEAELGPGVLQQLSERTGVTWLGANLSSVDASWSPQSVVTMDRGGLRIAVVGVIDPDRVDDERWETSEPLPAALDALRGLRADVRIVLAYMQESELRQLAESLPEVDFVVGGPTGQAVSPQSVGFVTVLSATNKGKFMARLDLTRPDREKSVSRAAKIVEVASSYDEDPDQLDNLAAYYRKLAERDFTAESTGLVPSLVSDRSDYAIAGSDACASCHRADDAVWHESRHSHAWDVLAERGAHFDPYCQQCHTTGYGMTDGFASVSQSSHLVHVGCENCHGPSQAHVANPRVKTPYRAQEQCLSCHDHENSPDFEHDVYWEKIVHGANEDGQALTGLVETPPNANER